LSTIKLIGRIVTISSNKKAKDIAIYKVGQFVDYTDFLVVLSINNPAHAKALLETMLKGPESIGVKPYSIEGLNTSWVVLDLGEVIVHMFDNESRNYYDIDGLWMDAQLEQIDKNNPQRLNIQ